MQAALPFGIGLRRHVLPARVRAPHKRAGLLVRCIGVLGGRSHESRKNRETPCNGLKRRAGGMTKLGPLHSARPATAG